MGRADHIRVDEMRTDDVRPFRIERRSRPTPDAEDRAEARHREVLEALRACALERRSPPRAAEPKPASDAPFLRQELKRVYAAIEDTKRELAALRGSGLRGACSGGVGDELAAVVAGTEQATETILTAAERIDQDATTLSAALHDQSARNLVSDIQDHVVCIFQACNFQDLTGQRIAKIVSALALIEARVGRMAEIWGGPDAIAEVEPERTGDQALPKGPGLEGDSGLASQADIDALFL